MAELTERDVELIVDRHDVTRELSSGQKWDVAWIVAITLGGIFAILGGGVGIAAFFSSRLQPLRLLKRKPRKFQLSELRITFDPFVIPSSDRERGVTNSHGCRSCAWVIKDNANV